MRTVEQRTNQGRKNKMKPEVRLLHNAVIKFSTFSTFILELLVHWYKTL